MGFKSFFKAYLTTSRPWIVRYKENVNADPMADLAGVPWVRDIADEQMAGVYPPFNYVWKTNLVTNEEDFRQNTVNQILATADIIAGAWSTSPLFVQLGYESIVGGGDVLISAPIPNNPEMLYITFNPRFYHLPISPLGELFVALSSTPFVYTATARKAIVSIGGGTSSAAPP